ncbi:nuclear envelope pore membrane protein POM 121 [Dermacentor silvarum]|uniref:nuclear envelope pore membrane protein POM 121 n=1 Tax=Dermacentor silvarum TaxID=543639 RepID=UPI00189A8445|nr:nuclear envelope pore membrane protein POM 121 [Dermacentor silvarum]
MADATTVTGYDPTSLRVVTMETTSSDQAMPSEHEYLADMVKLWQGSNPRPRLRPKAKGRAPPPCHREISETYTSIDREATCTPVTENASGFPTQAWITSPDPGEPTADHLSALPAACRGATSELSALRKQNALLQRQIAALTKQVATFQLQQQKPAGPPTAAAVKPVDHQPSPRATPTPRTPPAPPASSTAPAAQSVTGAPQSPLSIDHTLPLEDRITRLENVVLYQISTINVQYIVAEVVQAVQAWALTQFRTRSRSRSASTSGSSAPRRRKVAGSSSPALNPASIPLPATKGQRQGMEDDP